MADVKVLKLVSGEEIMGRVTQADKVYTVENPLKIIMIPSEGGMGMALIDYIPYVELKKIEIKEEHVIVSIDPPDNMKQGYTQEISGLFTPCSSGIIQ